VATRRTSHQWGLPGDTPLVADFDGDGKADLVVYRPTTGTWYVRFSSTGYAGWAVYQWGVAGDIPLAADFDGDGKTDLVVWRPGTAMWYVRFSSGGYTHWTSYQWGVAGDVPLVTDLDGDGKTDLVVFRPITGTWYVRFSSSLYAGGRHRGAPGGRRFRLISTAIGEPTGHVATGHLHLRFSSTGYDPAAIAWYRGARSATSRADRGASVADR
jgi:hypothetical protein